MSETAHEAPAKQQPFMQRHHFLLRRLHSLTGVMPIGVFLINHLLTNSSVVWGMIDPKAGKTGHGGVATFQHEVDFIHSLPYLIIIEIFGLWLPIAFHSVLGVYYATTGRANLARYPFQDNWRYTVQRISGYVGVLFIFYHVATLRWGWTFLVPGGTRWSAEYAASTLAQTLRGHATDLTLAGVGVSLFYMLGVSLLVFHLANGLWTAAITWGLTVSRHAQRRWGYACAGLGAALMAMAWSAVIGFVTLDPVRARLVEESMRSSHLAEPALAAPPSAAPRRP